MAVKILHYLKIVEEATSRDIKEVIGEKKEIIDECLSHLIREGYVTKIRSVYHVIKKANWKDTFLNFSVRIPFKMPYFYDIAHFNWCDMLLLGSKSKWGKTTIAMNMIKRFVDQGIKPYYLSLEAGSRFIETGVKLGLKEGDYFWDFQSDVTKIELEKNSITIIDWLLISDKSQTDSVLKHFVEQLFKTNGFLIIFMQLKMDGTWFAPNMVEQFPSLGARYLYDSEEDGTRGKWIVNPIRERKQKVRTVNIPCIYDFDTKIFNRIDELETQTTDGGF